MKKALPIGTSNYQQLKTGGYYVIDKTLLIQEYLERKSKVTLITRPRRFGKTSAMSMMSEFFDITKDSKDIFKDTKIINTEYAKEINQYPTIFISFADAKGDKVSIVKALKNKITAEYVKYSHVLENIPSLLQPSYQLILKGLASLTDGSLMEVNDSLLFLMQRIYEYYGKQVMLFIDEYDTPFIEAHVNGFYEELRAGLAGILHSSLKDNDSLQYALLTGIQRVAKENIFSDLNNLKVYTVKNNEYAQYFGFTKDETKELLEYYDLEYNNQVKDMYDGYRIGGVEIYNPWSIINYADEKELRPYWVNTSSNGMIKKAMDNSNITFKKGYETLIEQGTLETRINMGTSFYEQADTENLWGLFVNAGYLTIDNILRMNQYRIRIPNNEVREEFMSLTAHYLKISDTLLNNLFSALEERKQEEFISNYESILLQMSSYHDLKDENSYHMLMLGMCAWLQNDFKITSNRESGKGRNDIILDSKKGFLPSFVIEFKYLNKEDYEQQSTDPKKKPELLKQLAKEAILQIEQNKYDCELTGEIIHIGLAHAGKDVEMIWKERNQ